MTPMDGYKYMRLKLSDLPENVIKKYNFQDRVTIDGYVYLKIRQGMYGLTQTGILSQKQLEKS